LKTSFEVNQLSLLLLVQCLQKIPSACRYTRFGSSVS